jgi:hypothetical protein
MEADGFNAANLKYYLMKAPELPSTYGRSRRCSSRSAV